MSATTTIGASVMTISNQESGAVCAQFSKSLPTSKLLHQVEGSLELLTGERVNVRPIRPDDTDRLQAFHARLSAESVAFRFFRYLPALPRVDAERFTHVDYTDRMALLATDGPPDAERILAVVRYDRISADTAEVAFVVGDHWQGHGIATALLHRLAVYARLQGITRLLAITLAANAKMLEVLRHAGYPLSAHYCVGDGQIEVTLDISAPVSGEPAL
jgi:RimJ/RimL family protein N-acetyltransferase